MVGHFPDTFRFKKKNAFVAYLIVLQQISVRLSRSKKVSQMTPMYWARCTEGWLITGHPTQRFWLSYLLNLHFVSTARRSMISSILRGFFLTNTKFHHRLQATTRVKVIFAFRQTSCSSGVWFEVIIDSSETSVLQPPNGPKTKYFWGKTGSEEIQNHRVFRGLKLRSTVTLMAFNSNAIRFYFIPDWRSRRTELFVIACLHGPRQCLC